MHKSMSTVVINILSSLKVVWLCVYNQALASLNHSYMYAIAHGWFIQNQQTTLRSVTGMQTILTVHVLPHVQYTCTCEPTDITYNNWQLTCGPIFAIYKCAILLIIVFSIKVWIYVMLTIKTLILHYYTWTFDCKITKSHIKTKPRLTSSYTNVWENHARLHNKIWVVKE